MPTGHVTPHVNEASANVAQQHPSAMACPADLPRPRWRCALYSGCQAGGRCPKPEVRR